MKRYLSIRDAVWLVLAVGLAVGWWVDHRKHREDWVVMPTDQWSIQVRHRGSGELRNFYFDHH